MSPSKFSLPIAALLLCASVTVVAVPSVAADGGSTTVTLLHLQNVTVLPGLTLPPVPVSPPPTPDVPPTPQLGEEVANVILRDQGTDLCVDVSLAQGAPQNLLCVARLLLGPADGLLPRGPNPLVVVPATNGTNTTDLQPIPAGSLGSTEGVTMDIDVYFQYDAGHIFQAASLLNGTVPIRMPFAPTPDEATWFTQSGNDTSLTFSVTPYKNGTSQGTVSHSIPFIGQVLGTVLPPECSGAATPPDCVPAKDCAGQATGGCVMPSDAQDPDGDNLPNEAERQMGTNSTNRDAPLPSNPASPSSYQPCEKATGLFYICYAGAGKGFLGLGIRIGILEGLTIGL